MYFNKIGYSYDFLCLYQSMDLLSFCTSFVEFSISGQRSSSTTRKESRGSKAPVDSGIFGFLLRPNKGLNHRKITGEEKSNSKVDGAPGSTRAPHLLISSKKKGKTYIYGVEKLQL